MSDLMGYTGKILWVDLSAENYKILNTEDYLPKWVGGRGIGAMIHWQYVKPETKAFDPEKVAGQQNLGWNYPLLMTINTGVNLNF